jgi:F-type H+-transporting ATPase subunit delta
LIGSAASEKSVDALWRDLDLIRGTLASSRELRLLVASPVVKPGKKGDIFSALFGKTIGRETQAFLDLLLEKQREEHLPAIITEFNALCDLRRGIVNVHVISAAEISPAQKNVLQNELGRITGKEIRLSTAVDATLRGGLVVRIGDTVLDASIRRQLEILRERFLAGGTVTQ